MEQVVSEPDLPNAIGDNRREVYEGGEAELSSDHRSQAAPEAASSQRNGSRLIGKHSSNKSDISLSNIMRSPH